MAEESEDFKLGIQIIPVGLYYSHYYNVNRELIVNFGKPIAVADFKEQYLENKNAAMMALRSELHEQLVPLTLNIESKQHYEEYETLLEISNNNSGRFENSVAKFEAEQKTVIKIKNWENENPEEAIELLKTAKKYQGSIDKLKISDKTLSQKQGIFKAILMALLSILSSPLFLYGWINNFISFWLPSLIVRKKMRDVSFWATFEFVLWIILIPIFTLLQTALVWIFTKEWWIALAYFVTLPLFGKLSMYLSDFYKSTLESLRYLTNNKAVKNVVALREKISAILKGII